MRWRTASSSPARARVSRSAVTSQGPFGTSHGSHRYRPRAGRKLGGPRPPGFRPRPDLPPVTVTTRAGAWPAGPEGAAAMRKVIEWTLVSTDGSFDDPINLGFMQYQDDAYLRDGLGLLTACDAILFGRNTYQMFAKLYQGGRAHPWADRMHTVPKYVFSSTLGSADWNNSTLVEGDAVAEGTRLKQQDGGDLLVLRHGRLGG